MPDLAVQVQAIEERLHEFDQRLRAQDGPGIEAASAALHKALSGALIACGQAQHRGQAPLTADLRHRLMLAQARVAGLQATVHRASSYLRRTLDVLLPPDANADASTYASLGTQTGTASALQTYRS